MKQGDKLPFDEKFFAKQSGSKNILSVEQKFKYIYDNNHWGGSASKSGQGSDRNQVSKIIKELPELIKEYNLQSILDIPCGDFNWMKSLDLSGVKYTGADIVDEIVEVNNTNYSGEDKNFVKLNIIDNSLPKYDLILCRDCFVHFSNDDIIKSIKNIKASKSKYLLTTTFTNCRSNEDIVTGDWRVLNLTEPPFCFPNPLHTIVEECTECNNKYRDKSLGLWLISDLFK